MFVFQFRKLLERLGLQMPRVFEATVLGPYFSSTVGQEHSAVETQYAARRVRTDTGYAIKLVNPDTKTEGYLAETPELLIELLKAERQRVR